MQVVPDLPTSDTEYQCTTEYQYMRSRKQNAQLTCRVSSGYDSRLESSVCKPSSGQSHFVCRRVNTCCEIIGLFTFFVLNSNLERDYCEYLDYFIITYVCTIATVPPYFLFVNFGVIFRSVSILLVVFMKV